MDPWRITAEDRQRHDAQFQSLGPAGGFVTGAQARNHFLLSGLPPMELAKIWALADYNADGRMSPHEFSIACFLIRKRLQGFSLPDSLPAGLRQEPSAGPPLSYPPHPSLPPPAYPGHSAAPTPPPATTAPMAAPGVGEEWAVPSNLRAKYKLRFNQEDRMRKGHLTGLEARNIFLQTGLGQSLLAQIWALADIDKDGKLTSDEFVLAMYFVEQCQASRPLPHQLPPELLPPSFRQQRQTMQQAPVRQEAIGDTQQPPPQASSRRLSQDNSVEVFKQPVSLEERRRENFLKGQAELEKRRAELRDQLRAEEEARQARERALREQQEQARLAKERARQQELERQREAQRQLEEEREAARRKAAEERERQRMEAERQRLEAAEQQRAAAAKQKLQAELDQLGQVQQRESNFKEELDNLAEKSRECQQRCEEHRSEIELHKSEIESMRSRHDQLLSDISNKQTDLEAKRKSLEAVQRQKEELSLKLLQSDPVEEQKKTLEANIGAKKKAVAEARKKNDEVEQELEKKGEELANTRNRVVRTREEADKIRAEIAAVKQQLMQQKQQPGTSAKAPSPPPPPKQQEQQSFFDTDEDLFANAAWPAPDGNGEGENGAKDGADPFGSVDWGAAASTAAAPGADVGNLFADANQKPASSFKDDDTEEEGSNQDRKNWAAFNAAFSAFGGGGGQPTSEQPVYDELSTSYRVLYDFFGGQHDELTVKANDVVVAKSSEQAGVDENWLLCHLGSRQGLVPKNYVTAAEPPAEAAASVYDELASVQPQAGAGSSLFAGHDELSSAFSKVTKVDAYTASVRVGHSAASPNELSLAAGQSVSVSMEKDNWLYGRLAGGAASAVGEGWFPKSCVGDNAEAAEEAGGEYVNVPAAAAKPERVVVSLYAFESGTEGDLNFGLGEEIVVVSDRLGDWWEGHLKSDPSKTGIFPANFVAEVGQQDAFGADWQPDTQPDPFLNNDPFANEAAAGGGELQEVVDAFAFEAPPERTAESLGHSQQQQKQQQEEVAVATAPYEAGGAGQLSLTVGMRIIVKKKPPSGWWNGEVVDKGVKKVGWFPASYTRLESAGEPARPESRQSVASSKSMPNPAASPQTTTSSSANQAPGGVGEVGAAGGLAASTPNLAEAGEAKLERVVAKYRYAARNDDELTFDKGTVITVIGKDEPDWHRGRTPSLREGLFPVNYVEPLAPDGATAMQTPTRKMN